ncbi:alpha/beta hydrolase family protein [Alishewanella jeotgali]|uniref:Secreted dipeptidyl aminopeptidase n=1 Tax=Alishewanella jeotgali KCTC 22429 TaxID=1129374 RepID=H3ZHH3_9ALTE|nr:S9 family peptidase [Alishewanella jeotgali]EHR39829.1 secreted dipeptidyl aminopeptidase [Alishewanella jeotgali KCTC 22429]
MQKLVLSLLLCLASFAAGAAIKTIDFFDHAKVKNMKISPDGKQLAFNYEEGSEVRLAVMQLSNMQIKSSFAFGENKHVLNFHWANNDRVLMEVAEVTGNLVSMQGTSVDLYAANPDGRRRTQLFQTNMSTYTILHLLPDQPDRILIGKYHWAEKNGMRAFTLDVNRGTERFLDDQPPGVVASLMADNSGTLRMGIEFIEGKEFDQNKAVLHIKQQGQWQRMELPSRRVNPLVQPLGFSADNKIAYFISNFDLAEGDRQGVFAYDFDNKTLELVARHEYSDINGRSVAHDGELLAVNYVAGIAEHEFITASHPGALLLAGLKNAFEGQKVTITSFDRKGQLALFHVSGDRNPGEFYLYDMQKKQARYLASVKPNLDVKQLVPMQTVSFAARDGLALHGYLTLPQQQSSKLPLIVNVHGGPYGPYDSWGFNAEAQFFAHHGYATLQVNFRGSGGYGEDFQRAGRLQWGRAMQDDLADAVHWAVAQGIADPERVCIYGGSYGGYAAIWGVIKDPELYRCAVGYVGVYDMPLFFKGDGSDASRSRNIGQYLRSHVGEGQEYLQSISPVHNVDKIQVPLLIVHGSKDVRVPIVHANNLRRALDAAGKQYQWLVKEDGHGFYQVANRVELYETMLTFFNQHIGQKTPLPVENRAN